MKFSIFGFTVGSAYSLTNLKVASPTHLGFRVRYAVEGVSKVDIKFNGGAKTLDNIGDADVTDIVLSVTDVGDINVSAHHGFFQARALSDTRLLVCLNFGTQD